MSIPLHGFPPSPSFAWRNNNPCQDAASATAARHFHGPFAAKVLRQRRAHSPPHPSTPDGRTDSRRASDENEDEDTDRHRRSPPSSAGPRSPARATPATATAASAGVTGTGTAWASSTRGSSRSRRWRCSKPSTPTATASSPRPRSTRRATTATRRTTPTPTASLSLEEFAGLWHETTRPLTVRAFQMLDTDGDAVVTRAEYDRPLAEIVQRLDRDGDGGLSMGDRWHDDDDGSRRLVGRRLGPPRRHPGQGLLPAGRSRDAPALRTPSGGEREPNRIPIVEHP